MVSLRRLVHHSWIVRHGGGSSSLRFGLVLFPGKMEENTNRKRHWGGARGDGGGGGAMRAGGDGGGGVAMVAGHHEGNGEPLFREEKPFSQRSLLFVGNLPYNMNEEELRSLFAPFGGVGRVFICFGGSYGFVHMERRFDAELAKAELDGSYLHGRNLRVKFASQGSTIKVRNLHPTVSNELLEAAFSRFGEVERAVVVCTERGRSTGRGIVQFARRQVAKMVIDCCSRSLYLLTTSTQPVILEMEEETNEDGVPEKVLLKHPLYSRERELPPRFAEPGSLDYQFALQWKNLFAHESRRLKALSDATRAAREHLMVDLSAARLDQQVQLMRQELEQRQDELRRFEEHLHHRRMETERRKREDLKMQAPEQPETSPATVAAASQATTLSSQHPPYHDDEAIPQSCFPAPQVMGEHVTPTTDLPVGTPSPCAGFEGNWPSGFSS